MKNMSMGYFAPLEKVALTGRTPYTENRRRTLSYLRLLPADMMLYSVRRTFGEDTAGADAPGGWEAEGCLLRGHSLGHFISALSLAYRATGDRGLYDKLVYTVKELRRMQLFCGGRARDFVTSCAPENVRAEDMSRDPSLWGEGYIGAYPPDQFALLESLVPYPKIWAPYYTMHKLLAGFLDCFEATGLPEAKDAACGLGDWIYDRLGAVPEERREEMWSTHIAGEYGGMNEALARLYELTENEKYLSAAKLFDNKKLFSSLADGRDELAGLHANQHIPQLTGAALLGTLTEDEEYLSAARGFFDTVTGRHMYATGGVGKGEAFGRAEDLANDIDTDKNCETCAAYNMMKLARTLFSLDPERSEYMAYYERALVNHILPSQSVKVTHRSHAGVTYMLPIGYGARRDYSDDFGTFTCCHGTGMENHVKYGDSAYFVVPGEIPTVYVCLYLDSDFRDEELGIDIKVKTSFPFPGISVTVGGAGEYDVKFRIPEWASRPEGDGGRYAASDYIKAEHAAGTEETYELGFEYTPRLERIPGSELAALMYGPFVMTARDASSEPLTLKLGGRDISECLTLSQNREAGAFCLVGFGHEFFPSYEAQGMPYHTYFIIK